MVTMSSNPQFVDFCSSLKEKYQNGITNNIFKIEIVKDKKNFNFIKNLVLNTNYSKNFIPISDSTSGKTQTPTDATTPVLPKSPGSSSTTCLTPISSSNSAPDSPFRFGCTSKFSKVIFSSYSLPSTPVRHLGRSFPFNCNNESPIISVDKISAPVSPINLGFSSNISDEYLSSVPDGIKKFCVNDHDLQKSDNFFANKYKLDFLTVCNILINSDLPNLNLKQPFSFTNCYFTIEKKESIKIPCEWTAVRGGSGHKVFFIIFEEVGGKLQAINVGKDVQENKELVIRGWLR